MTTGPTTWGDSYSSIAADELVTGESVTLELPAASVGLRLVSGLIDVVIAVVVLIVGFLVTGLVVPDDALAGVGTVLTLVVAFFVVPTTVETLTRGRSIGKLATGLRTVRDDAGPITFQHAFTRALVGVVEIFVLSGVPALICAMVTARGKRLGDLAAGTYVVRDRLSLTLTPPVAMPPELQTWARTADIAPLPPRVTMALRQLLARSAEISPQAREALTLDLAGAISPLVAPPPPPGTHPERFLAAVQAERNRRDSARLAREASLRDRLTRRTVSSG